MIISPKVRHHLIVFCLIVSMFTLGGCAATLFALINATSGDKGLDVHSDIVFDSQHSLSLAVYAPHAAHDLPVVVFFYGGSWQDGKRQWYQWVGETLARHGLVAVIPDYRKYPQVRLNGFMTDAADAVAWTHAHIAQYGGSPDALFLMGHSAGAQIGALLATNKLWLNHVGLQPTDMAGFIGLAGPYDFMPITGSTFLDLFGHDKATQEQSQPIFFVNGNEPPMLLMQGKDDDLVNPDNARSMARALRKQGDRVTLRMYPGIGHIRLLLSLSRPFRGSAPALHDAIAFIRSAQGS